jgi:hypothetical protein
MVSHDLYINSCATEPSLGGECSISLGIIGESETVVNEISTRTRSSRARGSETLRRSDRLAKKNPRRSRRLALKALSKSKKW